MPKHIQRILILIGGFAIVAILAAYFLTPKSFYVFGHYRADSVREIAAGVPKFKGPDHCLACHDEPHAVWSAGVHTTVKCEVCHGANGRHPDSAQMLIPTDTVRLCTLCHEAMPARPAAQPQIDVAEHAGAEQCIVCHDPHAPRIGGPEDAGTPEALAAQCAGCHGPAGEGVEDFPPLAGLNADYLITQLEAYRSGARANPMMNTISESLSDEDIAALAAHYSSLEGGKRN